MEITSVSTFAKYEAHDRPRIHAESIWIPEIRCPRVTLDAHLIPSEPGRTAGLAILIEQSMMAKTSIVEGDTFRELSKLPGVLEEGTISFSFR